LKVRGYYLLDWQTYHWVKQEMFFSVISPGETEWVYVVSGAKKFGSRL
jgi:hypothetical protein